MPNECRNNFKFVAKKETLDLIVKHKFSFRYFVRPPVNATDEWFDENWTTYKKAFDVKFDRMNDETLYVNCWTAWTVPINFLINLIKKFPDLYIFNEFSIELTKCGIVILCMCEGEIKQKEFRWFDPVIMDYKKGLEDGGGWCDPM